MTGEREPLTYTFNNDDGIGESSQELDTYGVWVKSAPQILSPEGVSPESLIRSISDNEEDLLEEPSEDPFLFSSDAPLKNIPEPMVSQVESPINPLKKSNITEDIEEESGGTTFNTEEIPVFDLEDLAILLPEEGSDEILFPDGALKGLDPQPEDLEDTAGKSHIHFSQPADETLSHHAEGSNVSIQLLRNITEELSVIKADILSIKQILNTLVVSTEKPVEAAVYESSNEKNYEKITLTGNELNNILNAPDFIGTADVPIAKDEELSADDLNFLQGDALALESLPLGDKVLDDADPFLSLEDTEEFRRLREEGDKPITESSDDGLIDNLLIESGSIKDIPIELNQEEESSSEAETNFNMGEALGTPSFMEAEGEPFDISHFLDEQPEISDEELDRIEKAVLQEFPTSDDPSRDSLMETEGDEPGDKKKRETSPEEGVNDPVAVSFTIREGLKTLLPSLDQLLESLPNNKVEEFEKSAYFDTYKKLFHELGLT